MIACAPGGPFASHLQHPPVDEAQMSTGWDWAIMGAWGYVRGPDSAQALGMTSVKLSQKHNAITSLLQCMACLSLGLGL